MEEKNGMGRFPAFRHLLVLILAILVTYLRATGAGALVLDDMVLIDSVRDGMPSLSTLFSGEGPRYFRPLAHLSYFVDMALFGADPVGMHFINILIHVGNGILVYLVALHLAEERNSGHRTALTAALLFGLHPVNAEAVVWISCRYDLLSCFFMLASLLLIVRQGASSVSCLLLPLLFLCSLLSKESSLLVPAAVTIFVMNRRPGCISGRDGALLCSLVLALISYLYLRNGLNIVADRGMGEALVPASRGGLGHGVVQCMAGAGFYLGKMLWPFPLSFAIPSISVTRGLVVFALLLPLLAGLFFVRRELRFPLALMAAVLSPPLYAMLARLAWTPYAERYLYLPMVGFSLLAAFVLQRWLARLSAPVLVAVTLFLALPTSLRVATWTDPVAFWNDTIRKAPGFGTPHLLLAAELISAGDLDQAERHLARAGELGITRNKEREYARDVRLALDGARKRQAIP